MLYVYWAQYVRLCLKGLYEQIKSPFTKNQLPYYRKLTLHEIKVLESNAT